MLKGADEIKRRLQSVAVMAVRAQAHIETGDAEKLCDELYDIEQDLRQAAKLTEDNLR